MSGQRARARARARGGLIAALVSLAAAAAALSLAAAVPGCGGTPSARGPKPRRELTAHGPKVKSVERGIATWYGRHFQGRKTASGERFDRHAYTAAHRTLPFGTHVRVINERTGKSVIVRINDRGPFGKRTHIIDLSEAAARAIGIIRAGSAPVKLEVLAE